MHLLQKKIMLNKSRLLMILVSRTINKLTNKLKSLSLKQWTIKLNKINKILTNLMLFINNLHNKKKLKNMKVNQMKAGLLFIKVKLKNQKILIHKINLCLKQFNKKFNKIKIILINNLIKINLWRLKNKKNRKVIRKKTGLLLIRVNLKNLKLLMHQL